MMQTFEAQENGRIPGRVLVAGEVQADLLYADIGLSFWGGVDPFSGEVIDRHHPLSGACVTGKILAIPCGRGSCTGSSVMLELILNGHAPAGLVLGEPDEILALGVLVAEIVFGQSFPVVCVGHEGFARLGGMAAARIEDGIVRLFSALPNDNWTPAPVPIQLQSDNGILELTAYDRELIAGTHGKAAAIAMRILMRIGELQGGRRLIDVAQAHIDGCIYTGPASLRFARGLVELGAQVRVPTTLNSISVDRRRWRELGIDAALGEPADDLGQAYLDMGARASFTCAPYLLDSAPRFGEHIVWAESNAVVFANSVLGARTQKYPDYLDICIALTGRAPYVGCHRDEGRLATVRIDVEPPATFTDAFYPLLGYHIGLLCGSEIPVICGLERCLPDLDDLKAFGAAFATTSAAPMFHIVGCTPEAASADIALGYQPARRFFAVERTALATSWRELDSAAEREIQLVSLGNPHLSLAECAKLATLCAGRKRNAGTALVVTLGRAVHGLARAAGLLDVIEAFGATVLTDTCWCMLGEPIVPPAARTLMTNSGKYAHYAPGLVGRAVQFGSLTDCVEAACTGMRTPQLPSWLNEPV
jgi:predicted aconitase/predicted aconitase with swiveling domain